MFIYEEMKGGLTVSMETIAYHETLIRLTVNIVLDFFSILMIINILQVAHKNVDLIILSDLKYVCCQLCIYSMRSTISDNKSFLQEYSHSTQFVKCILYLQL